MVSALPHLKGLALVLQHLLHKVHQAVAGGLRPDQRASKRQAAQPACKSDGGIETAWCRSWNAGQH